jgi:hypothetical protein
MLKISVRLDVVRARREFKGEQREVRNAALRAMDRVARTGRKVGDQTLRKRVTLKSRVVKNAIVVQTPYGRLRLVRDIEARGGAIPLRDYQLSKTRAGARFAIVKGDRKIYKRQGRTGFVVEKLGGHAFVRIEAEPPGPARAKIKKVWDQVSRSVFARRQSRTRLEKQ